MGIQGDSQERDNVAHLDAVQGSQHAHGVGGRDLGKLLKVHVRDRQIRVDVVYGAGSRTELTRRPSR